MQFFDQDFHSLFDDFVVLGSEHDDVVIDLVLHICEDDIGASYEGAKPVRMGVIILDQFFLVEVSSFDLWFAEIAVNIVGGFDDISEVLDLSVELGTDIGDGLGVLGLFGDLVWEFDELEIHGNKELLLKLLLFSFFL